VRGDDVVMEASMATWWTTDLQKRLTSECLQLHGGYGFMMEYDVQLYYRRARAWALVFGDANVAYRRAADHRFAKTG
jgi:alkylation response protein AidB-like acyl-CoA dehydrogenase